jgi:two-component system sensor histidine kinase BaeS
MRLSLLSRLVAVSLAVTVLAVGGTVLAALLISDRTVKEAPDQAGARAKVYDALLEYAATHTTWRNSNATVAELANATNLNIHLEDLQRTVVAEAKVRGFRTTNPVPVGVVDPLNVVAGLGRAKSADGILETVVGPYRVEDQLRDTLQDIARTTLECVKSEGGTGRIVVAATGRPSIIGGPAAVIWRCGGEKLADPTGGELVALRQLSELAAPCLASRAIGDVTVHLDYSVTARRGLTDKKLSAALVCVTAARRIQLAPLVAPPVLLTLAGPAPTQHLSSTSVLRIVGVGGAVLLAALSLALAAGYRVVKPLQALTDAAARNHGEDVIVQGPREVALLATAFNKMSSERRDLEAQRKSAMSDIAHELRTPLSSVRAWLEASRDGLVDDKTALAESLLEEVLVLQRIIDDLQLLGLAEAGQLRLHPRPTPILDILTSVQKSRALQAQNIGTGITVRAAPEVVAYVDPTRLHQIVDNLVSNALRYVQHNGRIDVTAEQHDDAVHIVVRDNGSGISETDLPHIFDRFWRAEKSRNRNTGGSGLGLAIVRQLVHAHHGTVTVTSRQLHGTTFTIRLPASPR